MRNLTRKMAMLTKQGIRSGFQPNPSNTMTSLHDSRPSILLLKVWTATAHALELVTIDSDFRKFEKTGLKLQLLIR